MNIECSRASVMCEHADRRLRSPAHDPKTQCSLARDLVTKAFHSPRILAWLTRDAHRMWASIASETFRNGRAADLWAREAQPAVLRSIAVSLGQGLAADLVLATRDCVHVRYCSACCDALRAVLRVPTRDELVSLASR